MEAGSRHPDARPILLATVRAAVDAARAAAPELPLLAGGKSMGGRMTSLAAAEAPLPGVHGLVFFGFPLHPAGRPSTERAAHLERVHLPMLFLQGERDKLAQLDLLRTICAGLDGPPCTWCRPRTTACTCSEARVRAMPTCSSTSPTGLRNGRPCSPRVTACEFVVPDCAFHGDQSARVALVPPRARPPNGARSALRESARPQSDNSGAARRP
jgi:hypothetical protein